ncbi:MAG TPA: permease-like cell division protein FtsX [Candidatus Saccharimonadales bacterium]|nr:permease-like cell division protein FtsX [Candidatus Saccharimonadales bacterium]
MSIEKFSHSLITVRRIVHTGTVNFIRNISLAIAAMAVMVVTLTIVLFSVITNATFNNTISQITSKINVSVFLKDSDTPQQTDQLISQLKKLPNVADVQYLDKQQALHEYQQQNAGNEQLLTAIDQTNNPIPATIHVQPIDLNKIQDIKDFLSKPEVEALQSDDPSYSGDRKEAIDKITHATNVLREIGIIAVIVFTVICALIIFNTIQMAIFNRRDEIQIQRLLGASTNFIRGPFVVETIIYGVLSAVLSVLIINSAFLASSNALQASSLGLLDINYAQSYFGDHFWALLALQLVLGIVLGAVSSIIATRRYLKFKTK